MLALCLLLLWPASLAAEPIARWSLENSTQPSFAESFLIASQLDEAALGGGFFTADHSDGSASREYPADRIGSGTTPQTGSYVEFTLSAPAGSSALIERVTWQIKARSFDSSVYDSCETRLFWDHDDFTHPISPPVSAATDSQLANGSWFGSWVAAASNFTPLALDAGESVRFRLVVSDTSASSQDRLRLDAITIEGSVSSSGPDPFTRLREKRFQQITGAPFDSPNDPEVLSALQELADTAANLQQSLNRSPGRSFLWADAASSSDSSQMHLNHLRLRQMALAYATPGCPVADRPGLRSDILEGLDWMHDNRYYAGASQYNNWWHWQIGSTQTLGDILILMHDELGQTRLDENLAALDFFIPGSFGWMTGANRSDKCFAAAMYGILARDSTALAGARDQLTPVFAYVTSGDGFYLDGSFIQHTALAYTGSYGAELINGVAYLYDLLADSPWQLTDPSHENMFAWIRDSYAPLYFRAAMPDHVRGRAISRPESTDRSIGHYILRSILRVGNAAPEPHRTWIRNFVRQQTDLDTRRDFASEAPLRDYDMALELISDPDLSPEPPGPAHFRFPAMDRVVHRREEFAFGVAMSSSRVYTYESINGENTDGWFTGDGVLSFHNADLDQFEDGYWATIDPYHLPGVTNPQATRAPASGEQKFTPADWVGGVDLSRFGSAGMQLDTWGSSLEAKKSWFFFDSEVVCLGADIRSTDSSAIHTTIENRRLSSAGDEALTINGAAAPNAPGWSDSRAVDWLALEGTGGIWFPSSTSLELRRETRQGDYADINSRYPSNPIEHHYLSAWIDHGTAPNQADYAYVLLPDADAAATAAFAASPAVEILANTPGVQAVRHASLGLTFAHFWAAPASPVGGLSCDGPAAVVIRENAAGVELAISDPTWQRDTPLTLTFDRPVGLPSSIDHGITVLQQSPQLILEVDPADSRGQSLRASFSSLVAGDDSAITTPGGKILLDVLANDSSQSGEMPELISVGTPDAGTASIRGAALFYEAPPGFEGSVVIPYTIADSTGTATAELRVDVTGGGSATVTPLAASASSNDGNTPDRVLDGSLSTRWSAFGPGETLTLELGAPRMIEGVSIAFFRGDQRTANFDLEVSPDGVNFQTLQSGMQSAGNSLQAEYFSLPSPAFGRFIRFVGQGNSESDWNSITEFQLTVGMNQAPSGPALELVTNEATPVTLDASLIASDPDARPAAQHLLAWRGAEAPDFSADTDGAVLTPPAGFGGEMSGWLQVSDGHKVGEIPVSLVIEQVESFAAFLDQYSAQPAEGLPDPGDPFEDPDHDGTPTLLEFLVGGDPRLPDAKAPFTSLTPAPETGTTRFSILLRDSLAGPLEFSSGETMHADIGGVRASIESSVDLADWQKAADHLIPVPASPDLPPAPRGFSWHSFESNSSGNRYFRLRAEPLPGP